jgi:hypothetical protein
MHRGRHPLRDGDSKPVQLGCLVRVVAQQGYPVQPQGTQHLRRDRVVAAVLAVAEREVGVVRVEAGVLEAVGVEVRIQTDPAVLLAQVERERPDLRDAPDRLEQLRPAVAPLAPEDVAGEALAVDPDQRRDLRIRRPARPRARCSRPSASPSKV